MSCKDKWLNRCSGNLDLAFLRRRTKNTNSMEYYIYPVIVSLPLGYDCTIEIPVEEIAARLDPKVETAKVLVRGQAYRAGKLFYDQSYELEFNFGKLRGEFVNPFVIEDGMPAGQTEPAYLELMFETVGDEPVFTSKRAFSGYTIYSKPGKKSFLSDNSYKYGSPPVIGQMAKFGKYVDANPVIHLDREMDLGESLFFINPYRRPILAKIATMDGRHLPRLRVQPESALNVYLSDLLEDGEASWSGHLQVTANNRLVTFSIKHSMKNIAVISDHEHLDPYRSDPTHEPATLAFRKWVGSMLARFVVKLS